ncbi:MAG: SCP-2 sterol transfer family protein [Mycolicibacterium sp.]|nr:SCP-2 sterol transfer family protein [Mycolicibacterium sp.]
MAERVSSLLRRSVDRLANEVPDAYRVVVDRLGSLGVQFDVDGEVFFLSGGADLAVCDGAAARASVQIATTRAAMLDLIDAHVGLAEAVETGTVRVNGSLDDVQGAHDTLHAYVHAAVRATSHRGLLDALRAGRP